MTECYERRMNNDASFDLGMDTKSTDADLVTQYDKKCEEVVIDMLKVFWNQAYAAGTAPSTSINDFAELFYHKVHAVHQEALKQFPCCVDVLAPNDREVLKERLSPNKYAGGQNRYDGPFSHRIYNNTVLELIKKHL